ncbi:hypothetical protein ACF06T_30490 [Streptomyces albidoflavus]
MHDKHTGQNLRRLCRDELELHYWLASLQRMELRFRWAKADVQKNQQS